jgi:hypothetical protein
MTAERSFLAAVSISLRSREPFSASGATSSSTITIRIAVSQKLAMRRRCSKSTFMTYFRDYM